MSRQLQIAVIDDDDSFRTALVGSLGSLGYRTLGYASAEDFIASDTGVSCTCVITDIHMPGMSGIELARFLAGRSPRVPVIMVTARSDLGIDAHAAANGAICLLRKPFKTESLVDCLKKALKS